MRKPWYRKDRDCWVVNDDNGVPQSIRDPQTGDLVRGKNSRRRAEQAWAKSLQANPQQATTIDRPLAEVFDLYLQDMRSRCSERACKQYEQMYEDFLKRWPRLRVGELTTQHINKHLIESSFIPNTRRFYIGVYKAALNWAASPDIRVIPYNPIDKMRRPQAVYRPDDYLVEAEAHKRMLEFAEDEHQKLVLIALYETGCRPCAIASVTAAECDLEKGVWVLANHKVQKKVQRPAIIPLSSTMIQICERLCKERPEGPLFRRRDGLPWKNYTIYYYFRKIKRLAKVPQHLSPYAYRHGFGTRLLTSGASDAVAAACMGHFSTATIHRHYSHIRANTKELRAAVDKIS